MLFSEICLEEVLLLSVSIKKKRGKHRAKLLSILKNRSLIIFFKNFVLKYNIHREKGMYCEHTGQCIFTN